MTERMPFLLTESLDATRRELTHQHIESCDLCGAEWSAFKETWLMMGDLSELEVPARVKARFLAAAGLALPQASAHRPGNVVPFRQRPAFKWAAQAAAVALLVGGAYFAGDRNGSRVQPLHATVSEGRPFTSGTTTVTPISLAETRALEAEALPEYANAAAKVLLSDTNEGRKIGAAETLSRLPPTLQTRDALIETLKNDPNSGVRLKALEGLIEIARNGEMLNEAMVQTLMEKANQENENLYIRDKAAQALLAIKPKS